MKRPILDVTTYGGAGSISIFSEESTLSGDLFVQDGIKRRPFGTYNTDNLRKAIEYVENAVRGELLEDEEDEDGLTL